MAETPEHVPEGGLTAPLKFVLPRMATCPLVEDPLNMVIFSPPKIGKTTIVSALPDCLIIDLEEGSNYVTGMKAKAKSIKEIKMIGAAIVAANYPYKFIGLDTVTALEEICLPMAEQLYANTSMGVNWFTVGKAKYGKLLNMPNGAGYPYLREAMETVIAYVKTLAPNVILIGHVKDTLLERAGVEFSSKDLDLTGKTKRTVCQKADAIGYMYRKGKQTILSITSGDESACGARPAHLKGKDIVIAEENEDGTLSTFWSAVYPSIKSVNLTKAA